MKNTHIRNLLRSAAFLLLLALLLQGTALLLRPRDNTEDAGMELQRLHGFLGEPDDTIDVIFLGDSEAYSGYSPLEMWDTCGFTSYICAISGCSLDDGYAFLLEATAHQHPKLVVMEALPAFRKMSANDSLFTEGTLFFPVFSVHNSWKCMTPQRLLSPVVYNYRQPNRGYKPDHTIFAQEIKNYMKPSDKTAEIALFNRIYLDRIVRYCKGNDIPMLILSCPSPKNWNYARHEAMQAYADSAGVSFLDLNLALTEIGLDGQTDFRDEKGDHLNHYGAVKTSAYLAPILAQSYDLPDHREDPAYESWGDAFELYRQKHPTTPTS